MGLVFNANENSDYGYNMDISSLSPIYLYNVNMNNDLSAYNMSYVEWNLMGIHCSKIFTKDYSI